MLRIVVLVVVVAGLLIGGRAWVRGQDYLAFGNSARVPSPSHEESVDTPDGPRKVAVVPYRDGAEAVYGLAIRNGGPLSVKVTEVVKPERPDESVFMFRPVAVRMADREGLETHTTGPFRPFTLKKDHQRYVEVVGQLGDCEHYGPGSSEVLDSQPVQFTVLGQTLTDKIALPTRVEFRITQATKCPRPPVERARAAVSGHVGGGPARSRGGPARAW
jgi:hypothetical protein